MSTDKTLQSIADVLAANEQHLLPRDPNRPELHWRDISGLPAPRPVPSPEDRMTAARLVGTQADVAFGTYLDATERDQLDARAAAAEQERDEARDDLQELKTHHTELHTRLNATENDLRSQTRAVRELLADLTDAGNTIDAAQAALSRAGITDPAAEVGDLIGELAAQRDEARQAFDLIRDDRDRLRDANDTLALTLAEAIGVLAPDGGGCSRGWIPGPTVDRWRRALHEAEEARAPALGSLPPRAQEPSAADLLRQAAAGRREYAKAIPEKAEPLDLQAHTLEAAACVVEGDLSALYDWLPSWKWTDEMHARLHDARPSS